jgi:hypothetical protein
MQGRNWGPGGGRGARASSSAAPGGRVQGAEKWAPPTKKILPTPLHAWTLNILEYVAMSIYK